MQEVWTELQGSRIRSLVAGTGEKALVLWPGLGSTAEAFLRLLKEAPARGARVVAIDPPGHGRSQPLPMKTGLDIAGVWSAVMTNLGLEEAVMGGHSYGAVAALAGAGASMALRSRVQGLLLFDGGYLSNDEGPDERHAHCAQELESRVYPDWSSFLQAARSEAPVWDPEAEEAAMSMMKERDGRIVLRIDLDSCRDAIDLIATHPPTALPPMDLRALLLRATLPLEVEKARRHGVSELTKRVPRLTVQTVPGTAHEILDEAPETVSSATWDFLIRCSS